MLVISRGSGDSIHLEPSGTKFKIMSVSSGGIVRIAIDAPPTEEVIRGELAATWHGTSKRNEVARKESAAEVMRRMRSAGK